MLAFDLRKQMVVPVMLLVEVFIIMHTQFAVEERSVLPLFVGFDCKQFHKVIDFNLIESLLQLFIASKDSIVEFSM